MNDPSSTPKRHAQNHDRIGVGIALMVISIGVFTTMDAVVKHIGQSGYHTAQIIFFRNVFAFIPLLYIISRQGGIAALKTKRPGGHFLRTLYGLTAMSAFFYGYKTLPLADAISISFAAPLFMTALSVPMLAEKVGIRRWIAVLVGFVGVLIMVRPSANMDPTSLIMLGGTVFFALAMIAVRQLSRTETSASIVFYFTLIGSLLFGAMMPWVWKAPDLTDFAILASIGIIGGSAQLLMTNAVKAAPIAILAPFEYTALLWATGFDIVIWSVFPSAYTLIGAAILVTTGLYILHRETRRGSRAKFPARFSRIRVTMGERKP